jgi:hypothetical protein
LCARAAIAMALCCAINSIRAKSLSSDGL